MADDLEAWFERGVTDGLPVVPPTRPRVDAMLITHLSGQEGVSTLFHFDVELMGRDSTVDFDATQAPVVTRSSSRPGR